MPRRNLSDRQKLGAHHVWNRARSGRALFRSDADRDFFLDLIASRVSRSQYSSRAHRRATRVPGVEVAAVCLMTTHFHLIIWQHEADSMRRLMQSVLTAYGRYHHRKYGSSGPLFSGPYRSRFLENDKQTRWAIAYVHANHPSGTDYKYSSHTAYLDDHRRPGWLAADRGLTPFGGQRAYVQYMRERSVRSELDAVFF